MDDSFYSSDPKVENFGGDQYEGSFGGGFGRGANGALGGAGSYGHAFYPGGQGGGQAYAEAEMAMMAEEVKAELAQSQSAGLKHAERLLNYELEKLENNGEPELIEVDVPKPVKFNFVGKLLGPGGKTLQGLAKTYKCHVYVLGKGSTRDRAKEEEQLKSGDPKYAHFAGPLHVRVETEAPIPVAYTRVSGILNELHRLLQPVRDDIVLGQMEELNYQEGSPGVESVGGGGTPRGRGGARGGMQGGRGAGGRGGRGGGMMGGRGGGTGAPRGRGMPRGRGGPGGGRGGPGRGRGAGGGMTQEYVSYPGFYGSYGSGGGQQGGAEGGYDYSDQGFGGGKSFAPSRGRGGAGRMGPY